MIATRGYLRSIRGWAMAAAVLLVIASPAQSQTDPLPSWNEGQLANWEVSTMKRTVQIVIAVAGLLRASGLPLAQDAITQIA